VVFTWGWADSEAAEHVLHERTDSDGGLRAGSTRVVVTLEEDDGGTLVTMRHHDLPTDELRDAHRVAWQTYLGRLPVRIAGGDPGPDPRAYKPGKTWRTSSRSARRVSTGGVCAGSRRP